MKQNKNCLPYSDNAIIFPYQGNDTLKPSTPYLVRSWGIAAPTVAITPFIGGMAISFTQYSARRYRPARPRSRYAALRASSYRCRWSRVSPEIQDPSVQWDTPYSPLPSSLLRYLPLIVDLLFQEWLAGSLRIDKTVFLVYGSRFYIQSGRNRSKPVCV